MKKTFLLLIVTLTIFFPPMSIYLAINVSRNLQFSENQRALADKITARFEQLDRSIDESEALVRELAMIRETLDLRQFKSATTETTDEQLKTFLHKKFIGILPRLPFPVEINCLIQEEPPGNRIDCISFGKNLDLRQLTRQVKNISSLDNFEVVPTPVTSATGSTDLSAVRMRQLQSCFRSILNNLYSNQVQKMVIKEKDSTLMLVGERINNRLTIFLLAELKGVSMQQNFTQKIKADTENEFGVGILVKGMPDPVFSRYFRKQPELQATITRYLAKSYTSSMQVNHLEHEIFFTSYDQRKQCRLFAAIPAIKRNPSEASQENMLLALLFISSAVAFKVIIEKIIMGRGPDLSIKTLLPIMFLFLIIQPVFAAACLIGDFFHSSYENTKSKVSEKLTLDLQDIDLAALDNFRDTLNQTRSFKSIEKISQYTGINYDKNEFELCLGFLNRIFSDLKAVKFTSIWFSADERPFTSVRWHPAERIYENAQIDNPVTQLFNSRFQEIINETSGESKQTGIEKEQKFDKELKSEFSRDFFLKILGPEAFFRFRQNAEFIININATFKQELVIAGPISLRNRPYAYAAWHIGTECYAANFPIKRLKRNQISPRLAFTGNERNLVSLKYSINELQKRFPDLYQLSQMAHVSRARLNSKIEKPEETIILEAMPGKHSYHTLAGSEILQGYQQFRQQLTTETLKVLALLIGSGILLAFAGAVYFTYPLKELTFATQKITNGDFAWRIAEEHPDEFAEIGRSFNKMAQKLEEGQRLKSFVSDSVRREVEEGDAAGIADRAQTKHATIIFSAICGFAQFQKTHAANEVFALLKQHLQAADTSTALYGGEIDKMIEDKIMIVFEHDAENQHIAAMAINTAISIQRLLHETTGHNLGAGINTGLTVAGIMGAESARLSRTVVGDPVNLAARLASLAVFRPEGGIIISGQINDALPAGFKAEKLPISHVKGKTQSVEAYLLNKEI